MCCIFKLMRFQSLCGKEKDCIHTHPLPLGMTMSLCGCRLSWWASLGTNVKRHSSLSLDFSLSFPPVLQPTSSPLRCLSLFSFLFPPIILWVFCPFSLVFSTPPSFWVGEGHGLCLSYLNFHFPKECFRHAHLCTYTHANAYTLIQQAELLSCTHH